MYVAVKRVRSYRISVGVIVFFRFMAGVIMIVGAMISLVFMMMSVGSSAMLMLMLMFMFVTVFHVLMRMLMGVFMLMIVFVFSFHNQFSCISGLL